MAVVALGRGLLWAAGQLAWHLCGPGFWPELWWGLRVGAGPRAALRHAWFCAWMRFGDCTA